MTAASRSRRIRFAEAVALIVVAHHQSRLPFPIGLEVLSAASDDPRIHLDFSCVEDLAAWLPFFDRTDLDDHERPRTGSGDVIRQSVRVVWHGWSVTLYAKTSRPAARELSVSTAAAVTAIAAGFELPTDVPEFEAAHDAALKIDNERPNEGFIHRVAADSKVIRAVLIGHNNEIIRSYRRGLGGDISGPDGSDLPAGERGVATIARGENLADARQQLAQLRAAVPDADVISDHVITLPDRWFNHQVGGAVYLAMVDTTGGVHYVGTDGWQRIGRVDLAEAHPEHYARCLLDTALGAAASQADRPLHVRIVDELMPGTSSAAAL